MIFNHEQIAIFEGASTTTENMMVEALPGTGKSTVLVELLRYLKGSVFMCAFGKDAAAHLRAKAAPIVGDELKGRSARVQISTTHSLGMQSWMRAQNFGKLDVERSKVRIITKEMGKVRPLAAKYSGFTVKLVSLAKRAGLGVLSTLDNPANWVKLVDHHNLRAELIFGDQDLPGIIDVGIAVYKESLRQCTKIIDFDDQILAPLYYGVRFVKYDAVLVDEAQDTSPLRLHMLLNLPKSNGRIITVGDSNQAVMGFSGASINSMREIQEMTDAKVYPLNISYRLPVTGVEFARQFAPTLQAAPNAIEGTLRQVAMVGNDQSYTMESEFWLCAPFTSQDAILCRATRPLVELAYQMIRRHIPCRVEGREIGASLINLARTWKIYDLGKLYQRVNDYKRAEVTKLVNAMKDAEAENVQDRCDTLMALITATTEMGKNSTQDLVDLIDSIFGDTEEGKAPELCVLSTVHKAKGREWNRVFVLGYYQLMPSKYAKKEWEIQEEKFLQFISITRHKCDLVLVNLPEVVKSKRRRNNNGNA